MYNSPCKGCADRKVGCHSTCRDYAEYKINHEWELDQIRRKKDKDSVLQEYISKRCQRYLRRRGRK